MKSIAQKFIAVREFIAKLFWLSAISLVATGLVVHLTLPRREHCRDGAESSTTI